MNNILSFVGGFTVVSVFNPAELFGNLVLILGCALVAAACVRRMSC